MDKQLAQDIYEKAKLDTTRELCKLVEGTCGILMNNTYDEDLSYTKKLTIRDTLSEFLDLFYDSMDEILDSINICKLCIAFDCKHDECSLNQ